MAEHSRFFDSSVSKVREYTAGDWREYFSLFYKNGVNVTDNSIDLRVTQGTGMQVIIAKGYGFILGGLYHNDADLSLTIGASDATLDRIDRVVMRFDEVAKEISVKIKKGSLGSQPIAPSLSDTSTLKELSLAQIRIRKGATSILASDITDERMTEYCGVISPVYPVPAQDMWDMWTDEIDVIKQNWLDEKVDINSQVDDITYNYQEWLDLIQADLGARVILSPDDADISEMENGDLWIKYV
ncbi:MAG TPA: hypothetical protein VFC79_04660 [Tissierellaceae bacterium]|nr:hypothetical protein [Tissierellaceae bacterium]